VEEYENVIIGFGKGGKTLAAALAGRHQKTALIEKSSLMYGGTCINVACIPSKSLENSARQSRAQGGSFEQKAQRYKAAIEEKRRLTGALRKKNYEKLLQAGVQIIDGEASFTGPHTLSVKTEGGSIEIGGKRIFINTGSLPFMPPIPGLKESPHVYTSETMMEVEELPAEFVIIGGGYIGLEFASYYCNFGSHVTIIQDSEAFIPREDSETAAAVLESMTKRGISVLRSAKILSVSDSGGRAFVKVEAGGAVREIPADAILAATGRRPNIAALNLSAAGIAAGERGAVRVDEMLRTNVGNIWAMGDAAGGLQFTYISLDDSRIAKSQLLGDGSRNTANRGAVPYSVFIDPPLSRVGLTEAEARERGRNVKLALLPAAAIPKAQVLRSTDGLLKAVVDADSGEILGAHLFCAESHELINLIKLAMDARLPYTVLRDAIYTHPTMSEALNDLFATLK